MNYILFALLAIMFIAYVFLKRTNKQKRVNSGSNEQEHRIRQLEEELEKIKGGQA